MPLNKKKRDARILKSDQMLEEAKNSGATPPETSSEAILGELNKALVRDNDKPISIPVDTPTVNTQVPKSNNEVIKKEQHKPVKVGRKKTYEQDRALIHIRVEEDLKNKIDKAIFARKQTMQDYIKALIIEDLKKNETKYSTIYDAMMEFQKDFN